MMSRRGKYNQGRSEHTDFERDMYNLTLCEKKDEQAREAAKG